MKKEKNLAKYFEHTNATKPIATPDDIRKTCEEAKKYGFASVSGPPDSAPASAWQ